MDTSFANPLENLGMEREKAKLFKFGNFPDEQAIVGNWVISEFVSTIKPLADLEGVEIFSILLVFLDGLLYLLVVGLLPIYMR